MNHTLVISKSHNTTIVKGRTDAFIVIVLRHEAAGFHFSLSFERSIFFVPFSNHELFRREMEVVSLHFGGILFLYFDRNLTVNNETEIALICPQFLWPF